MAAALAYAIKDKAEAAYARSMSAEGITGRSIAKHLASGVCGGAAQSDLPPRAFFRSSGIPSHRAIDGIATP